MWAALHFLTLLIMTVTQFLPLNAKRAHTLTLTSFYDPWRPPTNLALALVRALFEHEELARPSDSGHYVVATGLFHHSKAKWDMMLGQRALVEPPSSMVNRVHK